MAKAWTEDIRSVLVRATAKTLQEWGEAKTYDNPTLLLALNATIPESLRPEYHREITYLSEVPWLRTSVGVLLSAPAAPPKEIVPVLPPPLPKPSPPKPEHPQDCICHIPKPNEDLAVIMDALAGFESRLNEMTDAFREALEDVKLVVGHNNKQIEELGRIVLKNKERIRARIALKQAEMSALPKPEENVKAAQIVIAGDVLSKQRGEVEELAASKDLPVKIRFVSPANAVTVIGVCDCVILLRNLPNRWKDKAVALHQGHFRLATTIYVAMKIVTEIGIEQTRKYRAGL